MLLIKLKKIPTLIHQMLLIAWTLADSLTSIARKIVHTQQYNADALIHILITSNDKCSRLIANRKLINAMIVLASSLARSLNSDHKFNNSNWKETQIDTETILLQIQNRAGAIINQNDIINILERNFLELSCKKVTIRIPLMKRFVTELKIGNEDLFLSAFEENLGCMIDDLSISPRKQRQEISGVISVLAFNKSMNKIHKYLTHYLDQCLANLENPASTKDIEYTARKTDSALYLIFELADKAALATIAEAISPIINELISKQLQAPMFSRGLRQSFLKGIGLIQCQRSLQGLIEITKTEEAICFLIIQHLMRFNTESNINSSEKNLVRNLLKISPNGLVLLARDLRRTVPNKLISQNLAFNECTSWLSETADKGDHRENSLAKCLVLHYANAFGPRLILWLHQNNHQIGFTPKDVAALSALAGFDVPFVLEANKRLYSDGLSHSIATPSKCNNIIDYMQLSLDEWEKSDKSANKVDSIANNPLVSVIFTTFKPNLHLFKLSLKSILLQTYRTIEVIIIDDCSPPESSRLLEVLIANITPDQKNSIVYKRCSSNVGQYVSRNMAIAMAKGEFIAIQDDDDISHPERLKSQLSPMLRNSAIMATYANHIRISENARILSDGNRLGEIMGDAPVSFIWRKQVFQEIGYFLPTKTRGDIEFRTRMKQHYGTKAIQALSQPLVIMRGGMATVSSDKEYYYRGALSALRYMMNHIPIGGDDAEGTKRWIPALLQ